MIDVFEINNALDLGNVIRAERKRLGFTQEQLAVAAGVGLRFVVELENGKATAQIDKAFAVAHAAGFTISAKSSGVDYD